MPASKHKVRKSSWGSCISITCAIRQQLLRRPPPGFAHLNALKSRVCADAIRGDRTSNVEPSSGHSNPMLHFAIHLHVSWWWFRLGAVFPIFPCGTLQLEMTPKGDRFNTLLIPYLCVYLSVLREAAYRQTDVRRCQCMTNQPSFRFVITPHTCSLRRTTLR